MLVSIRLLLLAECMTLAACSGLWPPPTFTDAMPECALQTPLPGGRVSVAFQVEPGHVKCCHGYLLSRRTLVTAGHMFRGASTNVGLQAGTMVIDGTLVVDVVDPGAPPDTATLGFRVRRICVLEQPFVSGVTADLPQLRAWPDYAVVELERDVPWEVPAPPFATRVPCFGDTVAIGAGDRFPVPGVVPTSDDPEACRALARAWVSTTNQRGTTTDLVPQGGAVPGDGWSGAPAFLWEGDGWRFCGVMGSIWGAAMQPVVTSGAVADEGMAKHAPDLYRISMPPPAHR